MEAAGFLEVGVEILKFLWGVQSKGDVTKIFIVENRGYFSDNCRLKAARIGKGLTAFCLKVKSA